jgi:hypothetical protein
MRGFASFERGGVALMDGVGPGAFWGDLSLVTGPRLCQVKKNSNKDKAATTQQFETTQRQGF